MELVLKTCIFLLKPLKGSEILKPIPKTIRTGNSANGSQSFVFHSLASYNVFLLARKISKPDST